MIGQNSSSQALPDQEGLMVLSGAPEETFYSEVLSGPQLMETADSDCSSDSDDSKVYISLEPERKLYSQVPCSPTAERLMPADRINVHSWKMRHPKNWQPQDITNWIYYVCSKDNKMDRYKIKAENFNQLHGHDMCAMNLDDFVRLEPNYGMDLFYCLQSLLKPAKYKAPVDNIEMTQFEDFSAESLCSPPGSDNSAMWSSAAMFQDEDQEMDLTVSGSLMHHVRSLDLDTVNPGSGVAVIGDKQYDYISDDGFEDIPHMYESGYDSGSEHSDGSSLSAPPPAHSNHPAYSGHVTTNPYQALTHKPDMSPPPAHQRAISPPPAHVRTVSNPLYTAHCTTVSMAAKPRGRPKREGHTPAQRGRKPGHSAKGNHLWKFIRDTINNSRYNPEIIRWEDQELGIFRIVNSAEMARLWGEKKNNSRMTYEKFSRAMRDYYKSNILRRVGSRKLVYAFGTKVFPHLVLCRDYRRMDQIGVFSCYG